MTLIKHVTFHYIKTVSMGCLPLAVITAAFGDAVIHIPILLDICVLYQSNNNIIRTAHTSADYLSKCYRIAKSSSDITVKKKIQELIKSVLDDIIL